MSEIKKATEFTVERSTWLRGEGSEKSKLLRRSDGKMCCMGFYALACGAKPDEIIGHGAFYDLDGDLGMLEDVGCRVYSTNDNVDYSEEHREARIARTLDDIGIKVTFVD